MRYYDAVEVMRRTPFCRGGEKTGRDRFASVRAEPVRLENMPALDNQPRGLRAGQQVKVTHNNPKSTVPHCRLHMMWWSAASARKAFTGRHPSIERYRH
ncbi:hypothetical protein J4G37_17295 [Microvirga sp. 3-52]|nr:hypothetical protein [Microvirga sp. 3-52]